MGVTELTVAAAAELEGVSERYIREQIYKGTIQARKAALKGGRNKHTWMVDPKSLTLPALERFERRIAAEKLQLIDRQSEKELSQYPAAPTGENIEKKTIGAAEYQSARGAAYEKARGEAMRKAEIVRQAQAVLSSKNNVTERIKCLARDAGIHAATIYRWLKKAETKEGSISYTPLLRQCPTMTKGKQFRAVSKEIEAMIRQFYQAPGEPKAAAVYRKVAKMGADLGIEVPSRATVFRFIDYLEEVEKEICCYTRRGKEAWAAEFAPHGTREEPERVMQIVMGDHHKVDRFINYGGRAVRPWITMWFDVKSRCPVGWTIAVSANSESIALAMAHMMTPKKRLVKDGSGEMVEQVLEIGGIPEVLYIDNGEDYKSKLQKKIKDENFALSPEALDLCAQLGVKRVFATPYRPQAKAHVERFFGTVAVQFSREHISWCGNSPATRPAGYDENKLLAQGKLQTLEEISAEFDAWVFREYLENVHGTIKQKPIDAHLQGEKLKNGWPSAEALDILRSVKEKAKVYAGGTIKRFNRMYGAKELDAYVGQNVIIRYDPAHIGEIRISTMQGKFICTASNVELMRYGACADDIKKLNARKRERKQAIRRRLAENASNYLALETVVAARKDAGTRILTGAAARSADGALRAITPLDHIGAQVEKDKKKRAAVKKTREILTDEKPRTMDPIEAMILNKGVL